MRLPNGYGSISKIKGNRRRPFQVRVSFSDPETGLRRRKTLGYTATKTEGLALLAKYNDNPWELDQKKTTVQEVFDLWLKHKAPNLAVKTVKDNTSRFNKYFINVKDFPYSELRLFHFLKIIDDSKLSNGGKENIRKFMRSLDEVAFRFDIIQKEYTKLIEPYKMENKERVPFTEIEIERLWKNLNIEDVDLVLLLIYTGFRSGEFCDIELENIDLNEWTIKGGMKTKAGKNRLVPVHEKVKPLLVNRMKKSKGNKLLNYSDKTLRIRFKKVMNELGMTHIPHECRHTLRTRLDDAGANKVCIDLILGHASEGTGERIYTHKRLDQLKDAMKLVS